jgi:PPOX class probable FMN-dependent enzyme
MTDLRSQPVSDLATLQSLVGGDPHPIVPQKIFDRIEERGTAFIEQSPFLLLSTSDREGRQDVSPKGDAPGFVWLENETTLWIPDRPGNKLAFGLKNILENPQVGVLFLLPGTEETFRVNGRAEIHAAPALLEKLAARGKPAVVAIRVDVEECFFHCAKAFKRSKLWKQESWPERFRISFGELLAPRIGGGEKEAIQIDEIVEQDYREGL